MSSSVRRVAACVEGADTSSFNVPIRRRRGRKAWLPLFPFASVVFVLIIWQVVGGHMNPYLLSTPTAVVRAFATLIGNGQLLSTFGTSMEDLWAGYALAVVVGIGVGILMGRSPVFEQIFNPYINFFQATPLIALVPLIVIWFGVGYEARLATTFTLAVWSIIINTYVGVKSTPAALIDVARVYQFGRRRTVTEISLPNAVPHIFAGLRIGLGKALIGMMIAEMEISLAGLGGLVTNYGNAFKTAYLLAGVFTASIVGVITAVILDVARRVFFPWVTATTAEGVKL